MIATTSLVWPIVGAIVAAVVVVAVVIVVIIIIYCVRKKNSSSKYEVKRSAELEMGRKIPSKPIIGGESVCMCVCIHSLGNL